MARPEADLTPQAATARRWDVAIVGGGVVGCAIARRFALEGADVVLLERAADILAGASKGNSALLHTGFDAPPDSLELRCMQDGYQEYLEIRERFGLPLLETGAAVVAWGDEDEAKLDSIVAQAHQNDVIDVRRIDRAELLAREPHLSPDARGAVLVPGEHVIDPWSSPLAYLRQAMAHGASVLRNAEVTAGTFDGAAWQLQTAQGRIAARIVINCAGLFGDRLEHSLLGTCDFEIRPRKGQFVVYDKASSALLRTIILPVPTERTKGIVVCRTIFGNVLVGPTAEEQQERDRATLDHDMLEQLRVAAARILPDLATMPVTATYAGLRPGTERKEYRIAPKLGQNWISVGGIRSTGLTGALGIARHVWSLYAAAGNQHAAAVEIQYPQMPNLAEHEPRDWQIPGYGEIVCHCEMVTRREIEQALQGPLAAGDPGGLKRRTRAGMGRCQGFYCGAHVAAITRGRFHG
jgi:glycerol-3-phosphate dehydrogenase